MRKFTMSQYLSRTHTEAMLLIFQEIPENLAGKKVKIFRHNGKDFVSKNALVNLTSNFKN